MICKHSGRDQEAFELLSRATHKTDRSDSPEMLSALVELGMMYQEKGRMQEAETAYLRMLHLQESLFGLNSAALVDPLSRLANLYHAMGKQTTAERIEERLRSIQRSATR